MTGCLDVSIVVPVKDEERSISELYAKVVEVLEREKKNFELIFVDDGSTDGSFEIMASLHKRDPRVKAIQLTRNFGKSCALASGFARAKGNYVITMDADLQDDPNEIPRFIEKLEEGYDLVCGWKKKRMDPWTRRVLSRIFNFVVRIFSGVSLNDFNCGFKSYRLEVVKGLRLYGELHRYIPVMVFNQGYKVCEIEVLHHRRKYGVSRYGMERIWRGFFDLLTILFLTQYSRRPLHLFGGLGIFLFFAGFAALLYLSILWLEGSRPIGTRPLFLGGILLLLLGGQLFSLGLLGELFLNLSQGTAESYVVKRVLE